MHQAWGNQSLMLNLSADEALGSGLAAVVEEEAELDGDVEDDAEHVGLERRAEAHGGLEVGEPAEEAAALAGRRVAQLHLHKAQHVGAHAQLQRVRGAVPRRRWRVGRRRAVGSRRRRRRRGRGRVVAAAARVAAGNERARYDEHQERRRREGFLGRRHCLLLVKLARVSW